MLVNTEVRALSISLPTSLHVEWSIPALEAGTHVLCPEPFGAVLHQLRGAHATAFPELGQQDLAVALVDLVTGGPARRGVGLS